MSRFLEVYEPVEEGFISNIIEAVKKVLKAVWNAIKKVYGFIKYGRYEPKDTIDICCIVQVGDGKGLANATIKSGELKYLMYGISVLSNSGVYTVVNPH